MSDRERNAKAILALALVIIAVFVGLYSLDLLPRLSSNQSDRPTFEEHETEKIINQRRAYYKKYNFESLVKTQNATHGSPHLDDSPGPMIVKRPSVTPENTFYEGVNFDLGALPLWNAPSGSLPEGDYLSEHDLDLMRKMLPLFALIMQSTVTLAPVLATYQDNPIEALRQFEQHSNKLTSASHDIRGFLAGESFANIEFDKVLRKLFLMSVAVADKITVLPLLLRSKQYEKLDAEIAELIEIYVGLEKAGKELSSVLQRYDPTIKKQILRQGAYRNEIESVIALCKGTLTPESFLDEIEPNLMALEKLVEELIKVSNLAPGRKPKDKEFAETVNRLISGGKALAQLSNEVFLMAERGELPTKEQCVAFASRAQVFVENIGEYMRIIAESLGSVSDGAK